MLAFSNDYYGFIFRATQSVELFCAYKQIARQSASSQLGGGAEAEGFNKTLSSLDINVLPKFIIYVVIFMSLVLLVSLIISSFNILRKNPKELLIDNN